MGMVAEITTITPAVIQEVLDVLEKDLRGDTSGFCMSPARSATITPNLLRRWAKSESHFYTVRNDGVLVGWCFVAPRLFGKENMVVWMHLTAATYSTAARALVAVLTEAYPTFSYPPENPVVSVPDLWPSGIVVDARRGMAHRG